MMVYLLCFLIGVVAGLRALTPLAAVSFAAALEWLNLGDTWLAFLGYRWTPWILAILALAEFVTDQLPATPSRKVPMQFGTRILVGGVCGLALATAGGSMVAGAISGAIGAVVGTLGGAAMRARLSVAFGKDAPAALLEDAIAVIAAILIVWAAA